MSSANFPTGLAPHEHLQQHERERVQFGAIVSASRPRNPGRSQGKQRIHRFSSLLANTNAMSDWSPCVSPLRRETIMYGLIF